jgi:CPA2 family monovalent cation:H+ antiporter-2
MHDEAVHLVPYIREILIFLLVAVVVVPLFGRLKVSPILGFLLAGLVIGPFGFAVISDVDEVRQFAELGVVFLLFKVGLELSLDRLIQMRRLVFGMGSIQVVLTGVVISAVAAQWGNSAAASIVIGFALALSSTAIVVRLLAEGNAIATTHGRASFSVLLFQDIAVVPILLMTSLLAGSGEGSMWGAIALAVGRAALAVAIIALIGRFVLRRLFHLVASARRPEVFMAMTLLTVLLTATGTAFAGLSMALGAFLAGLMLAGTEFRHQVESDIAPFEGLLLGLFFISVGMGIDLAAVFPQLPILIASVVGLMVLKAVLIVGIARVFGLNFANAVRSGVMLSQAGEFAFVVFAAASLYPNQLIAPEVAQFMTVVAAISMMLSPGLPFAANRLGDWIEARDAQKGQDDADFEGFRDHVIIAGFGRVGQTAAKVLDVEGIPYVAVDPDTRLIGQCRAAGQSAFFGDGTRADILERLGIERAGAVLITMNETQAAGRALAEIRRNWPKVRVFVRARDGAHSDELRRLGADHIIPETLEASLQLSGRVLSALGTPDEAVNSIINQFRENEYADLSDIIEPAPAPAGPGREGAEPTDRT